MPPLGLAYLSAFLKSRGVRVEVLDASIALYHAVDDISKEFWHSNKVYCWYLTDVYATLPFLSEEVYDNCVRSILSYPAEVIGFSVQNTSALFTLEIIKRIKAKDASRKIILGGPNCHNYSGDEADFKLLHDLHLYSDVVVVGEGEATLLDVLRCISAGKPLTRCKGVAIPFEGGFRFTGFAEPIKQLDKLPFPDLDAYQLNAYTDPKSLPILTSRGCVMKCVFCTDTYFWNPYRFRNTGNVFSEISRNKAKYNNRFFNFNDSLINGNLNNFMAVCGKLLKSKIDIKWAGNCRIDKRLSQNMLKKFKDSGCDYVVVGIESASDKILRLMRKGFTIAEAEQFLRACKDVGIEVDVNWIVGFPGEEEEDFNQTTEFIVRNQDIIKTNTFNMLTVNQFSYLERNKEEFGIILEGPHRGLWHTKDGRNTIDVRMKRLNVLETVTKQAQHKYQVVRQQAE